MKLGSKLAGVMFFSGLTFAQAPTPSFDVASVKANPRCAVEGPSGGGSTPGRITMECADLRDLILTAYGIYGNGASPTSGSFRMQVTGGPAWLDSTRYDIVAKPAGNPPRWQMYGPMLQALLEDRFKLKVHRESKDGPVYVLTATKNGPKLRAAKEGKCVVADINHPPPPNSAMPVCGTPRMSGGEVVTVDIPGATLANLCSQLGMVMDREVVDRTGIAGRFDIHLEVARTDLAPKSVAGRNVEQPGGGANDDGGDGPSLSSALEQQLGLKLQRGRGLVQVLVVDHIDMPAEN